MLISHQSAFTDVPAELSVEYLAQDPQWLALLHMQRNIVGVFRSEVDEPSFFLAGENSNPEAELQATLAALLSPAAGEKSAWCQYPARAAYLVETMGIHRPEDAACRGLQAWRNQFHTDKLVMIFPTMYMDNPASLFGHTFLRFDAADTDKHPVLLSRALSYYADVLSAGNTVNYILQGLAGGFDGVFEVRHYFEKIRKYSDNEDRDIWEYELDLSPNQIQRLIDHAWEVRGHTFHYFFLDENCSYRLIAMLDTVVAPYTMRSAFVADVMPLDTIHVLRESHLIRKATYVPSAAKWFFKAERALTPEERQVMQSFIAGDVPVEALGQPNVVAVASQYKALQMRKDVEHRAQHAQQLNALLQQSAVLVDSQTDNNVAIDEPSYISTDDRVLDPTVAGHGTHRVRVGWMMDDGKAFTTMGARLAYHDESDPLPGFEPGVQLEALDAQWRFNDGDVELDHITWFSVVSRKPRNDYFKPASWGIHLARRREMLGDAMPLVNAVDGERGVSYNCGAFLCYAELTGSVIGGGAVDQGWALGAGGRIGALYQSNDWSLNILSGEQVYWQGESHQLHYSTVEWGYRLDKNLSWTTGYNVQDNGDNRREIFSAGIRYFF
jgi:hypothetical protein